jgi:hypothetical protein
MCKSKSVKLDINGSDIQCLFSKFTRLGASYVDHLFLSLRVSSHLRHMEAHIKTKGSNYSTRLKLEDTNCNQSRFSQTCKWIPLFVSACGFADFVLDFLVYGNSFACFLESG